MNDAMHFLYRKKRGGRVSIGIVTAGKNEPEWIERACFVQWSPVNLAYVAWCNVCGYTSIDSEYWQEAVERLIERKYRNDVEWREYSKFLADNNERIAA